MKDYNQDNSKIISISRTVKEHQPLIPSLIAIHTLSGCDSVPTMFGIGKAKALEVAKVHSLQHLGNVDANIDDVFLESKRFIARCYGQKEISSSENRLDCCFSWLSLYANILKSIYGYCCF